MTARETLGDRERETGEAAELRRARHMHYDDGREFRFAFNGGVTVTIPLAMVPELGSAATAQLRRLNLSPSGDAIESPGIDRHIAVPDLIREVLGFGEIPPDPEWRVLADHDFEGPYEWVNAERDPRAPEFVEPKPMDGIPPIAVLADNQRRADHAHAHRYVRRMRYDHARREFFFLLNSGVTMTIPLALVTGLASATPAQLRRVKLSGAGGALELRELDIDISLPGLIRDVLGFEATAFDC